MTLVSSGAISMGGNATVSGSNVSMEIELASSYGGTTTGTNQISMNDSAVRTLAGIASGAIAFSNLYGKSSFTPVTRTYTSGSGTETIPTGASQVVIEVWGAGGSGGRGSTLCVSIYGGGGGSGGYVKKTFSLTSGNAGQTFNYSVGTGGAPNTGNGLPGGNSTSSQGTFGTAFSLTAGGGAGGTGQTVPFNGGTGGSATGGDVNTSGNPGQDGSLGTGGSAPNGGAGGAGPVGSGLPGNGTAPGGGGGGGNFSPRTNGASGGSGTVKFSYT